jgi:hypothetical protein
LAAEREVGKHKSSGDASAYCLRHHVRLRTESQAGLGRGEFVPVLPQRHDLKTVEPVIMFTETLH